MFIDFLCLIVECVWYALATVAMMLVCPIMWCLGFWDGYRTARKQRKGRDKQWQGKSNHVSR